MTVQPSIFWGQFWDKGGVVGWVPWGPHHLLPANDWVCPWHTVNSATTKLRLLTCFDHTLRERLSLAVHKPTHPAISRFTPVKISQQSLLGLGSSKLLIQLVSYFPGCLIWTTLVGGIQTCQQFSINPHLCRSLSATTLDYNCKPRLPSASNEPVFAERCIGRQLRPPD